MGSGCCDFCCVVDLCCIFDCGDGGCSYRPSRNNSETHAKKIANELAEMRDHYETSAKKDEQEIAKIISENMEAFIAEVKKVNETSYGGRSLKLNIKGIEEQRNKLLNEIPGTIGNVIHDRLQLKDKELSVILKEEDDDKRAQNFEAFCERLTDDAKKSLKDKIREVVKKQQELIEGEINNRLAEVKNTMEASIGELEKVKAAADKGVEEKEKEELELMYKHGIYDLLASKLDI